MRPSWIYPSEPPALDVVWDHFTYKRFRGTIGTTGFYQNNAYSLRLFILNYRSAGGGVFWIEKWEKAVGSSMEEYVLIIGAYLISIRIQVVIFKTLTTRVFHTMQE